MDEIQDADLVHARREQICNAALGLFLEKGFSATTVRDICARSGVNQASFYDYVANKNDILRRLLNQVWFRRDVPTIPERIETETGKPFRQILREYFAEFWSKKRNGVLLSYRSVPHLQANDRLALRRRETRLMKELAAYVRQRTGIAEDDPKAEVLANIMMYMAAYAPLRDWLHTGVRDEVLVETVVSTIDAMLDRAAEEQAATPTPPAETA